MNQSKVVGNFLRCIVLLSIAPGPWIEPVRATVLQSFSQAERQRIENYGAVYCRALNGGTTESYSKALQEVFAPSVLQSVGEAQLIAQMDRLHKEFGTLEYHHSEVTELKVGDKTSYVLHLYARIKNKKNWQDFQFRLEETQPHKIKALVFIAEVAEPVSLPNGSITDHYTLSWLNDYIDKLITNSDLSGSVLIAQGDRIVFERNFGFADAKRTSKITSETRFNMASGSKMFTAIATAQLAAQGN